jgi:membrane protein DedA with SNARE-associated domain
MLEPFEQTILSTLQIIFDRFGWLGVFGLMIFENATGISPAEVILACAGWMLIERHGVPASFIPLAGFYAGLGSTIGACIPYWIARRGGRPLVERFARFFHIHLRYIEKVEDQCRKWGAWIVLVGRVLPGVRPLISIPAGLVRIPFPRFFLATFIGAYVWSTVLIGAGYLLGHEWRLIVEYTQTHVPFVLVAVLLLVLTYLVFRYRSSLPISGWMRRSSKELDS